MSSIHPGTVGARVECLLALRIVPALRFIGRLGILQIVVFLSTQIPIWPTMASPHDSLKPSSQPENLCSPPTTHPPLIPPPLPLRPQEPRLPILLNPPHKLPNLPIRRHPALVKPALLQPSHQLLLLLHARAQPLVQRHGAERLQRVLRLREL